MCSIDNNGNITCGAHGVLTTASGYTQTQIDNKIAAVTPTLTSSTALIGSTINVINGSHKLSFTGDYAFSYIYDNALSGSSRILTDFSAGPEYININVNKNGVGNGLTIRPTGVKSTALTIRSENNDDALTIQNSSSVSVCSINNSGYILCPAITVQGLSATSSCAIDNDGNIACPSISVNALANIGSNGYVS